ncbi:MAG: response regulator transcription factor [Defluviitaleaceae bacterium]|nr:response regulator transcription factor [Defluviitaleaceae bacterium]
MKILLIEDDLSLQKGIFKGLNKLGYEADAASNGEEALALFFTNIYALVVLDLNLPILQGMDVLKAIRTENKEIPVLILSARHEVEYKIEGFDKGANDYLTKPFHFAEFDARIRALLRRNFKIGDTVLSIGDVKIDTAIKRLFVHNKEIELTKKEYRIIEYLCLRQGKTIPISEFVENIWGNDTEDALASFKVHLCNLRKKIPKNFIKNVRGQGYYVE